MRFTLVFALAFSFAQTAAAQTIDDIIVADPEEISCEVLPLILAEPMVIEKNTALILAGFIMGAGAIRNANGIEPDSLATMMAEAEAICDGNPGFSVMDAMQLTRATVNWQSVYGADEETNPQVRRAAILDILRETEEQRIWLEAELAELDAAAQ